MPPKKAKVECDLEPYLQYHNRIASFLEWKLDWEINGDKPSPERLARAGFFYYTKAPYHSDNVVCPYCILALDSWEPHDNPMQEHRTRSPFCDFVLSRQRVRDMGTGEEEDANTIATANLNASDNRNIPKDDRRPKRAYKKRAVGASKANELALAGANRGGESPPRKRQAGRPRKRA